MNTSTVEVNKLIYGKDQTQGIVSVEVDNSHMYLYKDDGTHLKHPYYHWCLADAKAESDLLSNVIILEGEQTFKYLYEYESFYDYYTIKNNNSKITFKNIYNPAEAAMIRHGITLFKGLKVNDVSVLSFDIETVGLRRNSDSKTLIISNTYRSGSHIIKKMFSVDNYDSDKEMISAWCDWVREIDPSVMCGHNIFGYDLPYLLHCGKDLRLGRDGSIARFSKRDSNFNKENQIYKYKNVQVFGRQIIDTFFLSIKYDTVARQYPSYALKRIIDFEGLERKNRQHYDASKIAKNWYDLNERELIKAYAKDDADDSLALYDLMIPSYFYYTQSIPKTFQQINNGRPGSQINSLLVRSYLQDDKSIPKASPKRKYRGAISLGNPGIYSYLVKYDVASLYPSIVRVYKVYDPEKDPEAKYLQMVSYFTDERLNNKYKAEKTGNRYYRDMEQSQKIVINSAYGVFGTKGLNYNNMDKAEFITDTAQDITKDAIEWSKIIGATLANADTDSILHTKGRPMTMDEIIKDLEDLNSRSPDGIEWKRDGYYKKGIIISAKNYVLWDGKELIYKGASLRSQNKEPALTEMIKSFVWAALDSKESEIKNMYHDYIREANNVKDISRWASKVTVTEAVLEGEGTRQKKQRAAIGDKYVQEGDKLFMYPAISGLKQKSAKGKLKFYKKTGLPMMEPNRIVRLLENWNNDIDTQHLMGRVFDTAMILESVLGKDYFLDYTLKRNKAELEGVLCGS